MRRTSARSSPGRHTFEKPATPSEKAQRVRLRHTGLFRGAGEAARGAAAGAASRRQAWQQKGGAPCARDRATDGTFVFAVRSTGIYCRPSCPARRPRREQVTFFRQMEEAEAAGFRACRRCYPQYASKPEPQAEMIEQVCRYIEVHLDAPLRLADLSQQFHLSPYHLQRTFKRIKGMSPRQYAEYCRLAHFKARLQDGAAVTSALYDAGYHASSSMYERFPMQLGMTPTVYQRGGKGMHIGYTISRFDHFLSCLKESQREIHLFLVE